MMKTRTAWIMAAVGVALSGPYGCSEDDTDDLPATTGTGNTGGQGGAGGAGGDGGGGSPPDPTLDLGIISTNPVSNREAESTIAAAADGRVAIAWIGRESGSASHIGYTFSTDEGASWTPPAQLYAPGGGPSADPVLTVDAAGDIFLVWLEFAASAGDQDHIYVVRAPAGTTSFDPPVEVNDPADTSFHDKPHIGMTGTGTVIVTYTRGVGLVAARSSDGASWTRTTIVNEPPTRNHVVATCSAPGSSRVYATHLHYEDITGDRDVLLRWSDDDGVSWPAQNMTTVTDVGESDAGVDDPSCIADGDDVWVLYGRTHATPSASGFGTLYAIRLAHSNDGGQSITARYDAHDAAAAPEYLHPRFARDDAGGLNLVYYVGQEDYDEVGAVVRSRSADGGGSFEPSTVVHEPVTFLQSRTSLKWIGEYFGVTWHDGNLHVAYIDNASSHAHVAYYRTAVPLP